MSLTMGEIIGLLNAAQKRGIRIDKISLSKEDIKRLGLKDSFSIVDMVKDRGGQPRPSHGVVKIGER